MVLSAVDGPRSRAARWGLVGVAVAAATLHSLALSRAPFWVGLLLPMVLTGLTVAHLHRLAQRRGTTVGAEARREWPAVLLAVLVWSHALWR